MPYPNLLSEVRLGPYALKNRVMLAPMTRGRAGPTFTANPLMAEYYAQRASAGILITEGTFTSAAARGWYQAPCIYTPAHADAWKLTTEAVHAKGGRIFCQLWHTGRAGHSNFREGMDGVDDPRAVAPSAIKRPSKSGGQMYTMKPGNVEIETPRELATEEVDALADEFKNAAQMAKDAGFDGVEVHCANGYLLDGFLQSCSNTRTDKYGGSFENRYRVVDNILRAVTTVYEPDQVGVRISPNGIFNGMGSDDFRESFLYYAEQLSKLGLAYLHIMIGLGFGFHEKGTPMKMDEFRKVYPGTLVANVGYEPDQADKEIADGNADLVAIGRPFLSNPDYVERLAKDAPLAEVPPMSTWYTSADNQLTSEGYTDFPPME